MYEMIAEEIEFNGGRIKVGWKNYCVSKLQGKWIGGQGLPKQCEEAENSEAIKPPSGILQSSDKTF